MTFTTDDIKCLVPEAEHHGNGIWTFDNAISTDHKMFMALLTTRHKLAIAEAALEKYANEPECCYVAKKALQAIKEIE